MPPSLLLTIRLFSFFSVYLHNTHPYFLSGIPVRSPRCRAAGGDCFQSVTPSLWPTALGRAATAPQLLTRPGSPAPAWTPAPPTPGPGWTPPPPPSWRPAPSVAPEMPASGPTGALGWVRPQLTTSSLLHPTGVWSPPQTLAWSPPPMGWGLPTWTPPLPPTQATTCQVSC